MIHKYNVYIYTHNHLCIVDSLEVRYAFSTYVIAQSYKYVNEFRTCTNTHKQVLELIRLVWCGQNPMIFLRERSMLLENEQADAQIITIEELSCNIGPLLRNPAFHVCRLSASFHLCSYQILVTLQILQSLTLIFSLL